MEGRAPALDERMLRAVGHPLRYRVLIALDEQIASPVQLARQLGEPLGRVGHHVRVLARLGAIELVSTRRRRGATEHFYKAVTRPWFDDEALVRLPAAVRRTLVGDTLRRISEDVLEADAAGGFDQLRAYVSRMQLPPLDDEAMRAVTAILDDAVERAVAVGREAAGRAGTDGEPTELVLLHFVRPSAGTG
jgi:DNA-binding transcriptional ArsR family regulator